MAADETFTLASCGVRTKTLLLLLSHFSRVQPHRRPPTRLPHPWNSPGKNIGVGCHFLLQCMKVKSESEVAQSCPTLPDSMDCSPSDSSVRGIFQARVLEWGAIAFSEELRLYCRATEEHGLDTVHISLAQLENKKQYNYFKLNGSN